MVRTQPRSMLETLNLIQHTTWNVAESGLVMALRRLLVSADSGKPLDMAI